MALISTPTSMNKFRQIFQKSNFKYFLIGLGLILFIVIPPLINQINQEKTSDFPLTQPILNAPIPKDQSKLSEPITATQSAYFNKQKLVFTWSDTATELPQSIQNYQVKTPLINADIVSNLSTLLGFKSSDRARTLKETSALWQNSNGSLFASTSQNQLLYQQKTLPPKNISSVSKQAAIQTATDILLKYFGESFFNTLSKNPTVTFLASGQVEEDPILVDNSALANFIEIRFKQTIDNKPLVSLSDSTNTISLALDTAKNLYRLNISGGYLSIATSNKTSIIDRSLIIKTAPLKAYRIGSLSDVSEESLFLQKPTLFINVKKIELSYFLRNDNLIYPVYLLSGDMSAQDTATVPVTYLLPAVQE